MDSGSAPGEAIPGDPAALRRILRREQRLLRSLVVQLRDLHHELVERRTHLSAVELADAVDAAEYTAERLGVDELARAVITSGLGLALGAGAEPSFDTLLERIDGQVGDELRTQAATLRVLSAQLLELCEAVKGAADAIGAEFPDPARLVPPSLVAFLRTGR